MEMEVGGQMKSDFWFRDVKPQHEDLVVKSLVSKSLRYVTSWKGSKTIQGLKSCGVQRAIASTCVHEDSWLMTSLGDFSARDVDADQRMNANHSPVRTDSLALFHKFVIVTATRSTQQQQLIRRPRRVTGWVDHWHLHTRTHRVVQDVRKLSQWSSLPKARTLWCRLPIATSQTGRFKTLHNMEMTSHWVTRVSSSRRLWLGMLLSK